MTILWIILAVAFLAVPAVLGVMLWSVPPRIPQRAARVLPFTPARTHVARHG